MKTRYLIASAIALTLQAAAITPEAEKNFVETYKKAFETNDEKTLSSFLYTEGASPDTIEFFKMMQSAEAGKKASEIKLEAVSAEEAAKKSKPMEMPNGKMYVMPFLPTHQLVIVIEQNDGSGKSTSTSKLPVAEHKGNIVIPIPVPAK